MRRGTTPLQHFDVNIDLTGAEVVYVTYTQNCRVIVEREKPDIEITPTTLEFRLTQEETLRFDANMGVLIQIRARFPDGTAPASNEIKAKVEKILKEGVI